jgi:predicted N-acetyltransferase YhbS
MSANATPIRPMRAQDIPAGMRFRELAGWNQTEADWRRFLDLEPEGCFVACREGEVCGTVTTVAYEKRFGWIGMVLTDPAVRRQGIGTRLLEQGIASLEQAGVETVKLDATPMGRPLYLERGFADEYGIERWEGIAPSVRAAGLGPMREADLERVCAADRDLFGADRSRLLQRLWRENPRYSSVVYDGDVVAGYILGRAGARAHYIGPWVAPGGETAAALLDEVLSRLTGEPVFVDVSLAHSSARPMVAARGLNFQRPLTRMYRGPNRFPGAPEQVCSIAGPELG